MTASREAGDQLDRAMLRVLAQLRGPWRVLAWSVVAGLLVIGWGVGLAVAR